MIPSQLRGFFQAEARELVDRLTRGVAALRPQDPEDAEAMRDLLRAAHTLKGAAHVVGERGIATDAHAFEDALAAYRENPTPDAATGLMHIVDGLAQDITPAAPDAPSAAPQANDPALSSPGPDPDQQPAPQPSRTLRVDLSQAEALLNGVNESGTLIGQIRNQLERWSALEESQATVAARRLRRAESRHALDEQLSRLERQIRALYTTASQLRLALAEPLLLEAGPRRPHHRRHAWPSGAMHHQRRQPQA